MNNACCKKYWNPLQSILLLTVVNVETRLFKVKQKFEETIQK